MDAWDVIHVLLDLPWYLAHWRGVLGVAAIIGGVILCVQGLTIAGVPIAILGLLFLLWEFLRPFDRPM